MTQTLTGTAAPGCPDGCTDSPTADAESASPNAEDDKPRIDAFAEAVAMLARLPLTDAERAEAVRRFMQGGTTTPTPTEQE